MCVCVCVCVRVCVSKKEGVTIKGSTKEKEGGERRTRIRLNLHCSLLLILSQFHIARHCSVYYNKLLISCFCHVGQIVEKMSFHFEVQLWCFCQLSNLEKQLFLTYDSITYSVCSVCHSSSVVLTLTAFFMAASLHKMEVGGLTGPGLYGADRA